MQSYSFGSSRKVGLELKMFKRFAFPFSSNHETVHVSARMFVSLKHDSPWLLMPPTTGKVAQLDSEDAVLESPAKVRKVTNVSKEMTSLRRDNEIKAESVKILHKKIDKLERLEAFKMALEDEVKDNRLKMADRVEKVVQFCTYTLNV